ncbi:uncharacterized protein DUF4012 [Promicromonospora sp. AC04]|uniref:DUF4012 domain-containing protein n=1 Tax=Promicromonospora sp. AC04 TaxID=2135723 RepID=UPI000D409E0B|nr:DUF4012 domain-containing protein [Promicromonospora sp. AC04]PUB27783.1 uncharacterized protein DUF4012 [Promicromonospora sp. AC04]
MTHPGWGEKWASVPVIPLAKGPSESTRTGTGAGRGAKVLPLRRVGPPGPDGPGAGGSAAITWERPTPPPWRKPPQPRPPFWTRRRRRNLRIAALGAVGLLVVLGLLVAWVALDAVRARSSLEQAARGVATLQADAVAGRTEQLDSTVADVQEHAANARDATGGLHWSLVGRLPGVGPTVEAVAAMAATVDELAQGPLPQLADVVEVVDPATLSPTGGRVDLAPLEKVAPDVKLADQAVGYALQGVQRTGGSPMLPQVSEAVADLEEQLVGLRASTATAARAAQLIPPMLGTDGPRDYLVLVQNNAEPRSLGGIAGTVLVLHAEDGEIELTGQLPGSQVGPFDKPVVPLTTEERQIFGGKDLGRWMQNVTSTPDFPRAARIAREMWRRETGQAVDGVLTADPVVLAGLLGEVDTGPGGTLEGDDLVAYLLNGVYKTQTPEAQDAIFEETARQAFATLSAGAGDPAARVDALVAAAREGRLLVWSREPAEAGLLEGTVLDGALRGVNADRPVVGVFTQGIQMAKIAYYVDTAVDLQERETRPDGSRELAVTVTYTSRVDAGEVPELSPYIVGPEESRPGEIRLRALVYAPAGGGFASGSENSEQIGLSPQKHDELWLSFRDITLRPGATSSVTYVIITGKHQDGDVILRTTPGPRPVKVSIEE